MIAAEAAGDWERLAELETALWTDGQAQSHGRAPAHVRDRVLRWIRDEYLRTDGKATRIRLDPPAVGRLHEIRVPTLVILGDLDTSSILRMADVMVEGIAGARKTVCPGVAHMLPLEIPDEFNQTVLTFLP